jgi:ABC-type antimicrobial peptide transport system permease subunit
MVIVVSEAMAKSVWRGEDALGRCVKINADTSPCRTVVGVAQDIRSESLSEAPGFQYYVPLDQFQPSGGGWFVRTRDDATPHAEEIRRALQKSMPGDAYLRARPMSDVLEPVKRSWQLGATLFVAFGGLALVLATIGLYSVIAYNVAQRMHELGVRIALGAQARDVARLVLSQGLRVALIGLVLGAAAAVWAGKFVEKLLFNETPNDPLVYAVVTASLLIAAIAASVVPAMRATRVDPVTALRSE